MDIAQRLTVIFTLPLLDAFFVAREFATISTRRSQIGALKTEGTRGSTHTMYALEHVSLMLTICQLGVTIASATPGLMVEPTIVKLVEKSLVALGASASSTHLIVFLLALALALFLHVVFTKMIPRNVSTANPARMLLSLAPVLIAVGRLLRPIIRAMDEFANHSVQLFGMEPESEITATSTTEKVAFIAEVPATQGALSGGLGLSNGALEFSGESIQSAIVPLDELVTLESTTTPAQVERRVAVTGFSRFPITNEGGVITDCLHLRDVFYAKARGRDVPVTPWRVHEMGSINAKDEVEDALRCIQKTGTHYALVVDNTRRVSGVLFLEDVLEELIGEMKDGLQRGDLAWEWSEERWALGRDVDRHSASSFRVESGSSCGTRGPVWEGGELAVGARFSRG